MRSRAARIIAIVWVLLWLGVIVPGHVRGAIPLPGTGDATGLSSCSSPGHSCCTEKTGPARPPAPLSCAVCDFVATLSTPPAMIDPPPLVLRAELVPPPAVESLSSIAPPRIGRGRAPPVV